MFYNMHLARGLDMFMLLPTCLTLCVQGGGVLRCLGDKWNLEGSLSKPVVETGLGGGSW